MKNIVILDDEYLALEYIKEIFDEIKNENYKFKQFNIITTSNEKTFTTIANEKKPDIIFLDISMPEKNGIEIAEEIRNNKNKYNFNKDPIIIFMTAHENYGYQAFKVEAFDYLLKPTDKEQIENLFEKIFSKYNNLFSNDQTIIVPYNGIDIEIKEQDIIYFKAEMKYITISTKEKQFIMNSTLITLEKTFTNFVKTHRSYLINPAYITKFIKKNNHWHVLLKTNETLPVSLKQKQEISGKLNYKIFI